jgi:hypothetical protein
MAEQIYHIKRAMEKVKKDNEKKNNEKKNTINTVIPKNNLR